MFPFLWSVSSALKTGIEVLAYPPKLLPAIPQWGNFAEAWTSIRFGVFFKNSIIVTFMVLVGTLVSSTLVAYGFARFRFPGREILFLLCLSGMMMPVIDDHPSVKMFVRCAGSTRKPLISLPFLAAPWHLSNAPILMSIPSSDESRARGASPARIWGASCCPTANGAGGVAIFTLRGVGRIPARADFLRQGGKIHPARDCGFCALHRQPAKPREHLIMACSLIATLP
jgi:hypothetical protein